MAKRISIYVGAALADVIGQSENVSGRLNTVADRYLGTTVAHLPELAVAQWCAICDANNSVWLLKRCSPTMLWANVCDTPGLAVKWRVDINRLIDTMRAWSYAEAVAATEVVERFWTGKDRETAEEAVARAVGGADKLVREDSHAR